MDDIIPPSKVAGLRQLGEDMDIFQSVMKQIINFQTLLYDGLNDLAGKFNSLKTEVSYLNNQLLNVDDSVQSYLSRNPVVVYTRDGVKLDDSLDQITDKIYTLINRVSNVDSDLEKTNMKLDSCLKRTDIEAIEQSISATNTRIQKQDEVINRLANSIDEQRGNLNDQWNVMRGMFRQEAENIKSIVETKVDYSELEKYITHNQVLELTNLFTSIPIDKKTRIPDIIPQVFNDSHMNMEQKIERCYQMLTVERKRVETEEKECIEQFDVLKKLAQECVTDENKETSTTKDYDITEVRDVGCDSGFVNTTEKRKVSLLRNCKHISLGTQITGDSASNEDSNVDNDMEDVSQNIKHGMEYSKKGSTEQVDYNRITSKVVDDVQKIVENQLNVIFDQFGGGLDKKDIVAILKELKVLQTLKVDVDTLKTKIALKLDTSVALQEFESFVRRDELFKNETLTKSRRFNSGRLDDPPTPRSRTVRTVMAPIKKELAPAKGPLPLVPARNSRLLACNERYAPGDDGKLYIREITPISLTAGTSNKNAPGSRISYYDRSKMTMEVDGVEAVLDFQPYTEKDSKNSTRKPLSANNDDSLLE